MKEHIISLIGYNWEDIKEEGRATCIFCFDVVKANKIKIWTQTPGKLTANCPKCYRTSLLPGVLSSQESLKKLQSLYDAQALKLIDAMFDYVDPRYE